MSAARMPVVFFGHGTPMNVVDDNRYTQAWKAIAGTVPKPKAILCVSAHWFTEGVGVTAMEQPKTIHDFYGFPKALYEMRYPAAGSPPLARQVRELLAPVEVALDQEWGLDHGTWSVLHHAYPDADVPVVQLSIDRTQPGSSHYALGRQLAPLREQGVLIAGSGNVVHHLGLRSRDEHAPAHDWADRFNRRVRALIERREHAPLVAWESMGEDARLAINSAEHYLPLLYCLGLQRDDESSRFAVDGIEMGSLGMLSVVIGG
ncbi:MAG: 4,5-DOPA dioxygenase extradiol [Burkholderiales bacterium]